MLPKGIDREVPGEAEQGAQHCRHGDVQRVRSKGADLEDLNFMCHKTTADWPRFIDNVYVLSRG